MKKLISLLLLPICFLFCAVGCDNGEKETVKTELGEDEKHSLQYYRTATLEDNFEDDRVNVFLKSAFDYLEELRFKDIAIVELVSQIDYIEVYLGYPASKFEYRKDGTFPLDSVGKTNSFGVTSTNHRFTIVFKDHSKEKVLQAIELLNSLDIVLCAEADFIDECVDL